MNTKDIWGILAAGLIGIVMFAATFAIAFIAMLQWTGDLKSAIIGMGLALALTGAIIYVRSMFRESGSGGTGRS